MNPGDLNKTIPIIFHAGTYGTYLEWVLDTLTSDNEIILPFNNNGNSHKFKGMHLLDMHGWDRYIQHNVPSQFVRLHPKNKIDESIAKNIEILLETVDHIIYIYPDRNILLLMINNVFSKIWADWWAGSFGKAIDLDAIYNNWPVDKATPIEQIPYWIKREFLSFYLVPAFFDLVGLPPNPTESVLLVKVSDLLYNFENTITTIKNSINIPFTKSVIELVAGHQQMLNLQQYIDHDVLCNQIVNDTLTGNTFDWSDCPLTLPSESWIQWRFRELGYEMACHGLDILPTNTVQLKELLYKND